MRLPSFLLSTALCLAAGATALQGQTTIPATDVPRTISYQGLLTSTDGVPFADGEYGITVTLYGDEQGTRPVWRQTCTTQVSGGIFNLYLGTREAPLPGTAEMNAPLWVGTSVNGGAEMRPLTPLSASPYALNVPDRAITGGKLAPGAVTADKVDMDYISELRIDGQKVSGKGTPLNLQSGDAITLHYDEATGSLTIDRAKTLGQEGDEEKGASVLATNNDVWTMRGNGRSLAAGFPLVAPAAGDWIGTNNAVDFIIKVNNQQTMQYQQTGAASIPNIIGGQGNTITAATSVASIIAGGTGSGIGNGNYNVIGGGNTNAVSSGDANALGGGGNNRINNGDLNVVAGGSLNAIDDGSYNSIGGGENNALQQGDYNTVAGGYAQVIANGSLNTITGGNGHNIDDGRENFIGGGKENRINHGNQNSAVGGTVNTILYGDFNTVGGGIGNTISNPGGYTINSATIAGGESNTVEIAYAAIGGGQNNAVRGANPGTTEYAFIGGGAYNTIDGIGNNGFIGGGENNTIANNGQYGVIAGGQNNYTNREYTTVAGGQDNFIDDTSPYAAIGGGGQNNVGGSDYGTIGGGQQNNLGGSFSTISGGLNNSSDVNSPAATIGGGENNTIVTNGRYSTIGGGGDNSIQDMFAVIGGGRNNSSDNTSSQSVIGGGRDNTITNNGDYSAVGGGERNNAQGSHTTIPGGDRLNTNASYAQSAMGFFNKPRGSMPVQPSAAQIAISNDPLFMVGNGDVSAGVAGRSNAFEVSYNGHTSVYGVNGSGGTNPSITGGTFSDNVILAWAEVPAGSGPPPTTVTPTADFGTLTITRTAVGVYDVPLTITDPEGNPVILSGSSVTVTIADDFFGTYSCYNITATPVGAAGPNTFRVRITDGACLPDDAPFMFKVTGRP